MPKKEFKSLSECEPMFEDTEWAGGEPIAHIEGRNIDDIKEHIQKAQKRLKECFGVSIIGNKPYTYTAEMIYKEIDKIFKEEFGDKLS